MGPLGPGATVLGTAQVSERPPKQGHRHCKYPGLQVPICNFRITLVFT
jgi:hypothetical protein